MARSDGIQFCSLCGEELVKKVAPYNFDYSRSRVTLRCPKRKRDEGSFLSLFLSPDRHIEVYVEDIDTVLNYDPITGERIKHVNTK